MHHEQAQLAAQLSVVTLFGLLHHGHIGLQILFFLKGSGIDPCEHLIFFTAAPVSACNVHELERLADLLCGHQMGAGAQVCKFALLIEADNGILGKVLDQFHLIGLVLLLHKGDGLGSGELEALQRQGLLDDLLHFSLDLFQVIGSNGIHRIHIIIEAIGNGRTDSQLRIGP